MIQQDLAEIAAAEAEGIVIQIGLRVSSWAGHDRCSEYSLDITDDDVQPMEKAGIRIVRSVLMDAAFQRRDVTAAAITVDYAAIGKGGAGKFFHRHLLDIRCHLHFQNEGIAPLIHRQYPGLFTHTKECKKTLCQRYMVLWSTVPAVTEI